MKTNSRGRLLLSGLVTPKVHTQASIAKKLGVTPEAVRQWLLGDSRPKYEHRKALAREFGIAMDAWDDEAAESSGEAA